jgi:hypothetical protein
MDRRFLRRFVARCGFGHQPFRALPQMGKA